MNERGGIQTASLNLSRIVEAAFPKNDCFRALYALASAAMHSRRIRGIDLVCHAERMRTQARLVGLRVLERICNHDEWMDHFSSALRQHAQLDHAAGFGGTSAATTDMTAQQAFGRIEGNLVFGIDYTGEGTVECPVRIGSHLQFHEGSYALLAQCGIDVARCPRVLERNAKGHLCDRWQAPTRDYWFEVRDLSLHN
jgi:hypothetical protein